MVGPVRRCLDWLVGAGVERIAGGEVTPDQQPSYPGANGRTMTLPDTGSIICSPRSIQSAADG
jgi:hypothetical protein